MKECRQDFSKPKRRKGVRPAGKDLTLEEAELKENENDLLAEEILIKNVENNTAPAPPKRKKKVAPVNKKSSLPFASDVEARSLPLEENTVIKMKDYVIGKLIYNFGTRKEFEKMFVEWVMKTRAGKQKLQYEVSFLRKNRTITVDGDEEFFFTYPVLKDKWILNRGQIIQKVEPYFEKLFCV